VNPYERGPQTERAISNSVFGDNQSSIQRRLSEAWCKRYRRPIMKTMRHLGVFLALIAGIFVIVLAVSGWTAALVSIAGDMTSGNAKDRVHFGRGLHLPKE
jgi:hypothetical protein